MKFKKTLGAILASSFIGLSGGPYSNPIEKHALLVCSATETNTQYNQGDIDPIDVDLDTVSLSKIYKTLKNNGFKDGNIKILYSSDGRTMNFEEKVNHEILQEIKEKHFNGQYKNDATEKNINITLEDYKKKIDYNDEFVFYLSCHGRLTGTQHLGDFGRGDTLTTDELKSSLDGFNSRSNLFFFVSCYSGVILEKIDIENACMVSATQNHTLGWVDRNFDIASIYLQKKYDPNSDRNKDGFVDAQEAYEKAVEEAVYYNKELTDYFLNVYIGPIFEGSAENNLKKLSLIPKIEVGKFFIDLE